MSSVFCLGKNEMVMTVRVKSLSNTTVFNILVTIPAILFLVPTIEGARGFGSTMTTVFACLILVIPSAIVGVLIWIGLRIVDKDRIVTLVCAIFLAGAVILFLDNSFSVVGKLLSATGVEQNVTHIQRMAIGLVIIVVAVAILGIVIKPILAATSGAVLIFALVNLVATFGKGAESQEFVNFAKNAVGNADSSSNEQRTTVVIVLDGLIGEGGVDTSLPGGEQYAQSIHDLSTSHGIKVAPEAVSAYPATRSSIPASLNGLWDISPANITNSLLTHDGATATLKGNKLFDQFEKEGRSVQVYQTPYLNFCAHRGVDLCDTLNIFDGNNTLIKPEYRIGQFWMGFTALRKIYSSTSFLKYVLSAAHRLAEYIVLRSGTGGTFVPKDAAFGSLSMPGRLNQIANAALKAKGGTLLFAHILAPHYPYLLGEDCERVQRWSPFPRELREQQGLSGSKMDAARERHYRSYFAQASCVIDRLNAVMTTVGQEIDVVFLGDHGSRISAGKTSHFLSERDLVDNYSTFFASRVPYSTTGLTTNIVQSMLLTLFAADDVQELTDDPVEVWVGLKEPGTYRRMVVTFPY